MSAPSDSLASPGRERGGELWLLNRGGAGPSAAPAREPADLVESLAAARPERVLGEARDEYARGLARALGVAHHELESASSAADSWAALESLLQQGLERLLVVLDGPRLQALVAVALGMPPERTTALEVGPGRLVLLRDDPGGVVLRRSNVHGPEHESGTALPWDAGGGRATSADAPPRAGQERDA